MASHFTVTLDTTAPTVGLLSYALDADTGTLDVQFTVSEPATITMWVDVAGALYPLDPTGHGQLHDGVPLQGAAIVVQATDDVGNVSTTSIGTIQFSIRVLSVSVSATANISGMTNAAVTAGKGSAAGASVTATGRGEAAVESDTEALI